MHNELDYWPLTYVLTVMSYTPECSMKDEKILISSQILYLYTYIYITYRYSSKRIMRT